MANLGWIGMGRIGTPMALRLIAAGHRLTVWDVVPEQLAPAVQKGATAASSGAETAIGTDAVFLCVSDTESVERAVSGPTALPRRQT